MTSAVSAGGPVLDVVCDGSSDGNAWREPGQRGHQNASAPRGKMLLRCRFVTCWLGICCGGITSKWALDNRELEAVSGAVSQNKPREITIRCTPPGVWQACAVKWTVSWCLNVEFGHVVSSAIVWEQGRTVALGTVKYCHSWHTLLVCDPPPAVSSRTESSHWRLVNCTTIRQQAEFVKLLVKNTECYSSARMYFSIWPCGYTAAVMQTQCSIETLYQQENSLNPYSDAVWHPKSGSAMAVHIPNGCVAFHILICHRPMTSWPNYHCYIT